MLSPPHCCPKLGISWQSPDIKCIIFMTHNVLTKNTMLEYVDRLFKEGMVEEKSAGQHRLGQESKNSAYGPV